MSKTGNKIDYSLRIQKNVERKILGDIINSLSYFDKVNNYRYIGFGSFYYKDFLLLHEKYDIHKGISVEIDNTSYAKKNDILQRCSLYLNNFYGLIISDIQEWKRNKTDEDILALSSNELEKLKSYITMYSETLIEKGIRNNIDKYNELNFAQKSFYDLKGIHEISKEILESFKGEFESYLEKQLKLIIKIDDNSDILIDENEIKEICMADHLYQDMEKMQETLKRGVINRYIFNKPFGYIDIKFAELNKALDLIEWDNDQKNIIWLDYDSFIDAEQLNGLEKSIKKANKGDLIVFSTSMGNEDGERYESLIELKKMTKRVLDPIKLADCYDKGIPKIISKIVKDVIKGSIADKNTNRAENQKEFSYLPVIECSYADGMPMYTYGFIIYDEQDDIYDRNFPGNVLSDNIWFPKEKVYEIYVPALTHREVIAINQLLPNNDIDSIEQEIPFIEKKKIRQYMEIWRYYPNFMEVDYYV